ncbi:MAG TPA: hypothetical protein VFD46_02590 [Chryseolinea sp.]|nr:hypothetical protein [Chryseolinea sp.]
MPRLASIILFFIELISIDAVAQSSKHPKVFEEEEILSIRLAYSFNQILKSTSDSVYFSSTMYYSRDMQSWDSVRIGVRGRGKFRRENCFFTPIRIKIDKDDAKGTLFQGNRNLKLVLPCKTGNRYNDLVLKEYICYQMYEPLTPYTLNTRQLNATITDVGGKQNKTYDVKAFFIEDDDAAAKRFDGKAIDDSLHPRQIDDTCSIRFDLFEYMIANTDWSSTYQHNSKTIRTGKKCVPIAYDFDMAGFVNASYAQTNEALNIKSVRERVYRGYCRDENVAQFVRRDFIQSMPSVFDALRRYEQNFDPNEFAKMKKFIQEFFDILNNDKLYQHRILKACRAD